MLGEAVPAEWGHPLRLLPGVPLDYLHPSQPVYTWSPVGQHGDMGPDWGGPAGAGSTLTAGIEQNRDPNHQANTPGFQVHAAKTVQLCAAAGTPAGVLLRTSKATDAMSAPARPPRTTPSSSLVHGFRFGSITRKRNMLESDFHQNQRGTQV